MDCLLSLVLICSVLIKLLLQRLKDMFFLSCGLGVLSCQSLDRTELLLKLCLPRLFQDQLLSSFAQVDHGVQLLPAHNSLQACKEVKSDSRSLDANNCYPSRPTSPHLSV